MLPGRSVEVGGASVLVSPARVHVTRYLKGTGPTVVSVTTGVTAANIASEDGINPHPGQRWTIYTSSRGEPYETSICDGSHVSRDAGS